MRVAGALVPDLHPVSLTSSASAVLCCKGPLRYILRFVAYPDVGGWGDTCMCLTTVRMTGCTAEQPKVSRWAWLGFTFLFLLQNQFRPCLICACVHVCMHACVFENVCVT